MSTEHQPKAQSEDPAGAMPHPDTTRIDSATGLTLPDPFPEYLTCPVCAEPEVEVFCYQLEALCHNCGHVFEHARPPRCGTYPFCKRGTPGAA